MTYDLLENHQNEQYFFDEPTVQKLADIAQQFARPCCLCAPLVGAELEKRGVEVATLDCDERFSHLRGFVRYDVFRPHWMNEDFGVIVCDPPFWKVSLSQLFAVIRMLSHHHFAQPILLCYLSRRAASLEGTFAKFGLEKTGFHPGYRTVANLERNQIEFWANFEPQMNSPYAVGLW